jgi:polyphosphate kinase
MKASFIGQMWYLMKALHDDDDVEEELEGAETYMEKWHTTGDTVFRDMAKDELRHAGILIKKHYEWADDDKKAVLEEHENKRQELLKMLSSEKED